MLARMAMIAMTTSSSMRVNPIGKGRGGFFGEREVCVFISVFGRFLQL